MATSIPLDSYHDDSQGRRIEHAFGMLTVGPPRRFLFRYREDGCDTELTVDENQDGTFRAVFTYPPNRNTQDLAIASVGRSEAGEEEIEISGIHRGKPYDFTIYAPQRTV